MSQNYLNEADTDDEDEKCNITSSPEEVAEAQLKSLDLKGAMAFPTARKRVPRPSHLWVIRNVFH